MWKDRLNTISPQTHWRSLEHQCSCASHVSKQICTGTVTPRYTFLRCLQQCLGMPMESLTGVEAVYWAWGGETTVCLCAAHRLKSACCKGSTVISWEKPRPQQKNHPCFRHGRTSWILGVLGVRVWGRCCPIVQALGNIYRVLCSLALYLFKFSVVKVIYYF